MLIDQVWSRFPCWSLSTWLLPEDWRETSAINCQYSTNKQFLFHCSYFLFSPEASMSVFLSGIVVVQLVSHVPRTALNIYELCMVSRRENLSNIYIRIFQTISSSSIPLSSSWLVDLSHLLLAISSSSNVIIFSVQVNNNQQNCHIIYKTLI